MFITMRMTDFNRIKRVHVYDNRKTETRKHPFIYKYNILYIEQMTGDG